MPLTSALDLHVKPKFEFKSKACLKLGKCVIQNISNMESSNGAQRLEKIELLASLNPKDKA